MTIRSLGRALLFLLVASSPGQAAEVPPGFFPVHPTEPMLLNKPIEPAALRALQVWDTNVDDWRSAKPDEPPSERAPVVILHLWATYCGPCREEFPLWRELAEEIKATRGERARVVFLSETQGSDEMRRFFEANRGRMPTGPHFLDTAESVASSLRKGHSLPLTYPLTIVLDAQRVTRYVLVGRLKGRRTELLTTIDHLLTGLSKNP
jgi:thiol-disulfide isomerase/thioredoxin